MFYASLADAGTMKLTNRRTDKGVQTKCIVVTVPLTAATDCSVTLTDTKKTYVINLDAGINDFCIPLLFTPGEDVTITAAGAMTVFVETFE